MGMQNMTVKSGATLAPTGGTDLTFASDGQTIQNGVHLVVPAVTDYQVRPTATAKYNPPRVDSDGGYTRDKKSISYAVPMVTASGKVVYNSIRVERDVHPEFAAASALDLNIVMAQMLFDSDSTSFWAVGSIV